MSTFFDLLFPRFFITITVSSEIQFHKKMFTRELDMDENKSKVKNRETKKKK